MRLLIINILLLTAFSTTGWTQIGSLEIKVKDSLFRYPMIGAKVVVSASGNVITQDTVNSRGVLHVDSLAFGSYKISVEEESHGAKEIKVELTKEFQKVRFLLKDLYALKGVEITYDNRTLQPISFMRPISGMMITSGKKSNCIAPKEMDLNEGTANPRQVYQAVPGLNIWESDGAGLQLGIGGRGLSPHRTSNFNTRQNGYDISADALGYPETYYTPPLEALERIQLIRGAASLQFGTQFGGMLNFVLRQGGTHPLSVNYKKTIGSFQLSSNYLSIDGTHGRWRYFAYGMMKSGNDFRPNSSFDMWSGHANTQFFFSETKYVNLELTHMEYLAQQPGGLTDLQFEENPLQSNRDRNWFGVNWNLAAVSFFTNIGDRTKLESKFFGLLASRKALGFLGNINRIDLLEERDLILGEYMNWGNETRLINHYDVKGQIWNLLAGVRYYSGYSIGQQGDADNGFGPNFDFIGGSPNESDYRFPSKNYSAFVEHIFRFGQYLSVTPGVRFEHIDTRATGKYWSRVTNGAGDVVFEQQINENRENVRSFALAGVGVSYKKSDSLEIYGNISQNYRSINFTDMQINNPSFQIDPELKDERGYNADIGVRGKLDDLLIYDISAFYLQYQDRIGIISQRDPVLFNVYQYRTNIADSRTVGLESYLNLKLYGWTKAEKKNALRLFTNLATIHSEYFNSDNSAIEGKQVEHVPAITLKSGVNLILGRLSSTIQVNYVSDQYTDATNAESAPGSVIGIIPSYTVLDWSSTLRFSEGVKFSFGVNNLLNRSYFTRRAGGYPGPGIIPSPTRNFYVSLGVRI